MTAKCVDVLSRTVLQGLYASTCPLITPLFAKSCAVFQISFYVFSV